jgi:hypothetical protein
VQVPPFWQGLDEALLQEVSSETGQIKDLRFILKATVIQHVCFYCTSPPFSSLPIFQVFIYVHVIITMQLIVTSTKVLQSASSDLRAYKLASCSSLLLVFVVYVY